MSEIKSKDWCPTCLLQNRVQNVLQNRAGQFYTSCAAGHQFSDTEELTVLLAQARLAHPSLYAANAPAPPDPNAFAGRDIILTADVKAAIEELSGQTITGASDLKGIMFASVQEGKDKDNELRSLRALVATASRRSQSAHGSPALQMGQFIGTIPEWAMSGVASQSEAQGKTPEEWVSEEFNNYFESFFGATVQR